MIDQKPKRSIWDFLAFGISVLFSPYVTAAVFILVITYTNSQNVREFLPWLGIAFLFALIIPGTYTLWLIEKRDIRNLHLSGHNERKIPFLIAGISSILGAIALYLVGAARPVVVMGVVYAANALVIAILTFFWKVSVHMALFSAVVTVIVILFGPVYAICYLFLIPLAWSRIHRRRHTTNQVIGGAMMAFVITALVFWLYGYI